MVLCDYRDRFRDGYESLRKAFETVDTNRDGYISRRELQNVLFDFHYFLDDVQLNILLDRSVLTVTLNLFFGLVLPTDVRLLLPLLLSLGRLPIADCVICSPGVHFSKLPKTFRARKLFLNVISDEWYWSF